MFDLTEEQDAIQRVRRGDTGGLTVLIKQYQVRAVRTAYAITQDRALAEDVTQTVFLNLFTALHSFDQRRPFAPWFYKSVVNAAVKAVKKGERTLSLNTVINAETGETFVELLPDLAALPIEQLESEEIRATIREALAKLTPDQRAVIVMRYYLDLETHEISEELHAPSATIRWRLHSALKRLRGLIAHSPDSDFAVHTSSRKRENL